MLHKTVTVVLVKQHVVAVWKLDIRTYTALHHSPFKYEAPAHTRGNNAAKINKRKKHFDSHYFYWGTSSSPGTRQNRDRGKNPRGPPSNLFAPKRLPHTKTPQGVHCSKHKLRRSEGTKLSP